MSAGAASCFLAGLQGDGAGSQARGGMLACAMELLLRSASNTLCASADGWTSGRPRNRNDRSALVTSGGARMALWHGASQGADQGGAARACRFVGLRDREDDASTFHDLRS